MAKRKGKSGRRIRNWRQKYASGENVEDAAHSRQGLARREVKIPAHRLEQPDENLEDLPKVEGTVLGLFPGGVIVQPEGPTEAPAATDAPENLLCGVAKTFRAPEGTTALAVGDWVTVALTRSEHTSDAAQADKDRTDGFVLARRPRESALVRPQPRSGKRSDPYQTERIEKVIVANVDQLLIVAATRHPPLRRGLIDRFLIVAEYGQLRPVLVINKTDLGEPDEDVLADFAGTDLPMLRCSAATGEGIDELRAILSGRRSVLAGASGVGKSTLVNALLPEAEAVTNTVREKDNRGRHTTSASSIYRLPDRGVLVDTPGVRELGVEMDPAELPWYFPEFEALAAECKFRDCTHTHEPHCAVLAAVRQGEIPERRYGSYLRLLEDLG